MGLAKTVLRPFFSKDEGETLEDAELLLWFEVLEPLTDEEIYNAVIDYQRNGPKSRTTHKLIKPAPGDIYERAMMERRRVSERKRHERSMLPPPPEPPKPPEEKLTDEQRQEVALTLKRFGIKSPAWPLKQSDSDPQGDETKDEGDGAPHCSPTPPQGAQESGA